MSQPLHSRVEQDILDKIQTGPWPVGTRLPREEELAEQMGISRSTLRLALSSLEDKGILQRKKRAGTHVIADRPVSRFTMVTSGLHDVLSVGRDTRLHITGTRNVADGTVDVLQGLVSETGYWLEITGTRQIADDELPFNWSQIYVTGRYAGIEPALGTDVGAVFEVVEGAFGANVARLSQKVMAIACPEMAAAAMGLQPGAPVMQILAHLFDPDDRLIEVSSAIFDPARFHINTDVRVE